MRFRDLICSFASSACEVPENIVMLHVRRGDMPKLHALIQEMDISLHGPIRRMPTGSAFAEVACCDAATASALLEKW